jgi:hypothetical protein
MLANIFLKVLAHQDGPPPYDETTCVKLLYDFFTVNILFGFYQRERNRQNLFIARSFCRFVVSPVKGLRLKIFRSSKAKLIAYSLQ